MQGLEMVFLVRNHSMQRVAAMHLFILSFQCFDFMLVIHVLNRLLIHFLICQKHERFLVKNNIGRASIVFNISLNITHSEIYVYTRFGQNISIVDNENPYHGEATFAQDLLLDSRCQWHAGILLRWQPFIHTFWFYQHIGSKEQLQVDSDNRLSHL